MSVNEGPLVLEYMLYCQDIDHITSETISCDPYAYSVFLNNLVDAINYHCKAISEVQANLISLEGRMDCVEARLDAIDDKLADIYNKLEDLDWLKEQIEQLGNNINNIMANWDWIISHLPDGLGNIPDSWHFAMGTINLVSNSEPAKDTATNSVSKIIATQSKIGNADIRAK